ncbi:MAG: T9SS type A sorting domain-containing protein, partial [Candidatus Cloacimonetes bacterium]|nr:T9SS type A sorting domain-containing protein [Candidatus Cloacimonadota bacterium]
QNYPNPFNPETTINFSLQEAGDMALEIYNIKGQRVTTLVSSNLEAGKHSVVWNGKDESGRSVVSGIYFYRMRSGKYIETKKMILLK